MEQGRGVTVGAGRTLRDRVLDAIREPIAWHTAAAFVLFAAIATGARLLADLSPFDATQFFLLPEALDSNIPLVIAGVAALVLLAASGRGSVFVRWADLDRGVALQSFAAVLMFFLTWRYVAAGYDYVYEQWHTPDRILLVVAALLALYRPIFLLLFIVEIRILQMPIRSAFDFASGATLDDLPILALIAIAAVVLLAMAVGHSRTETLVPLLAAAITIQFFVSGGSKLEINWLSDNDLSNFPLNGYQQGWLGSTDGSFADGMAQVLDKGRWLLLGGTLVLEVGAIFVILRRRLLMAALLGWVVFHAFVMAGYGFSFLEWALVEFGFFMLLGDPIGQKWSQPAFRTVPLGLTALAILFGGSVFRPPNLVWFDGPITYAYEFNGFDAEGNDRRLVSGDFAPHDPAFAFAFLHLGPTPPTAAGYGALNRERFDQFESVDDMADVAAIEATLDPAKADERLQRSVDNISQFLLATDRERSPFDYLPDAIPKYWTSREGQNYEDRTGLIELTVTRVTELRLGDDEVQTRREPVCTFFVDGEEVEVVWHESG